MLLPDNYRFLLALGAVLSAGSVQQLRAEEFPGLSLDTIHFGGYVQANARYVDQGSAVLGGNGRRC